MQIRVMQSQHRHGDGARRRRGAPVAAVLAGCLLAVSPAAAQDHDEDDEEDFYSRSGVYVSAQFSNNFGTFDNPDPAISSDAGEYATGGYGSFGYRINKYLAGELAGDFVSGWKVRAAGRSERIVGGTYGPQLRAYLKGERFQPYGLAGVGATFMQLRNSKVSSLDDPVWDLSFRVGAGFDWYANEEIALSVQPTAVIPVGINEEVGDLWYVSLNFGVLLRFGRY